MPGSKATAPDTEEDNEHEDEASGSADTGDVTNSEDSSNIGSDASDEAQSVSSAEPEARVLPKRTTRGNKMSSMVEEDEADQQFWGQEFFAEEERDTDWETSEDEVKDTVDSDFDKSEDEEDDEDVKDEPKERRAKALVAPGAQRRSKQSTATPKSRPTAAPVPTSLATQAAKAAAKADASAAVQVPQLRASTRARVKVAVKERDRQEQVAKKRPKPSAVAEFKPLTQEELLAEAAKTELDNERSLQSILAREEEIKKRQAVSLTKFEGVSIRFHSRTIASDADKVEQTRLEVLRAAEMPPHLRRRIAPPHAQQLTCCVTGLPARYRHPETGAPYATAAAFAVLEANAGKGSSVSDNLARRKNSSRQRTSTYLSSPAWQDHLRQRESSHALEPLRHFGSVPSISDTSQIASRLSPQAQINPVQRSAADPIVVATSGLQVAPQRQEC